MFDKSKVIERIKQSIEAANGPGHVAAASSASVRDSINAFVAKNKDTIEDLYASLPWRERIAYSADDDQDL